MDNQEQLSAASRAEYIRLARESCARNLSYGNGTNKNHGIKNKDAGRYEKQDGWGLAGSKRSVAVKEFKLASSSLKALLVRITIALALFLSVFLIDKFEVGVGKLNSQEIQNIIATNQGIDEAKDFFVSLYEKFAQAEE